MRRTTDFTNSRLLDYVMYFMFALACFSTATTLLLHTLTYHQIGTVGDPKIHILSYAFTYTALGSWVFLATSLAFKGIVRHMWCRSSLDYEVFRLLVRSQGSSARLRILRLLERPMNRLMLARELGVDWKSVEWHVSILLKHALIQRASVEKGRGTFYVVTERGRIALKLLEYLGAVYAHVGK